MHHVIIGGGPAATNAIETIREFDGGQSTITLICDEPAHSRMALPYWLAGSIPEAHTHTGDAAYFTRLKVATRFGVRVAAVDPQRKTVTLARRQQARFRQSADRHRFVAAPPRRSPAPICRASSRSGRSPTPMRVLKYAESLQPAGRTPRVVLVGAGFIGFIVLNAMYKRKWQLAVVEREGQVLPRMLDAPAADHVRRWLATRDIPVHCGATVQRDPAAGRRRESRRAVRRPVADRRHRDPGHRHPSEPRPAPGIGHRHRRGDSGERPDADEFPARLRGRRRGPGPGPVRRRERRSSDPADGGGPRPGGRRQHGRPGRALSGQPADERGRHLRPPGRELRSLERCGGRGDDDRQSRRIHLSQAALDATTGFPAPSSRGKPTTWGCSPTSAWSRA